MNKKKLMFAMGSVFCFRYYFASSQIMSISRSFSVKICYIYFVLKGQDLSQLLDRSLICLRLRVSK